MALMKNEVGRILYDIHQVNHDILSLLKLEVKSLCSHKHIAFMALNLCTHKLPEISCFSFQEKTIARLPFSGFRGREQCNRSKASFNTGQNSNTHADEANRMVMKTHMLAIKTSEEVDLNSQEPICFQKRDDSDARNNISVLNHCVLGCYIQHRYE